MARIRSTKATVEASGKKCMVWHIAVYIRLSKDDGNDESLSVTNQRKIITDNIERIFDNQDYNIVDVYIDDGRSGTTEEARPDFQRMLRNIEAGNINCVIVKTLSRAFRNYADQGKFLEQYLPSHRCRFIAISNPFVDTFADPSCMQNLEIPINGLMNDRYSAKTSADIRTTFDNKRRRGEFIGAFAPYGYAKDPEDKNALIIDQDAAEVVRDIYQWFVNDGMSKSAIAKRLNTLGVPNPGAYKRKKGLRFKNPQADENDGMWCPKTVRDILINPMYIGTMVQGKQTIVSYKVKVRVPTDRDDWFIVEGTHEPIVDRALFDAAQALHQRDTRTAPGKDIVYLFSGLLRCADCKKAMHRNSSKGIVYYACRTYREKSKEMCTKHSIRHDALEQAVLVAIQKQIELVASLAEMVREINDAPVVRTESVRLDALLKQKTKEHKKTIGRLDGLYLDMKDGLLARDQYRRLKAKLEKDVAQLQAEIDYIYEECNVLAQGVTTEDPYLTTFLKYRNIQSLSRGILLELVNTIYVHEGGQIEIEFNFADQHRRVMDFIENNRNDLYVIGGNAVS